MNDTEKKFGKLLTVIARLRSENGCPWDKKQTPRTLKKYLFEEAIETIEAIDEDDPDHVREELGDLLFLIGFMSRLYQEKGLFSMNEVLDDITKKMIRRHPHVFSNAPTGTEQDLRKKWLTIKAAEKTENMKKRKKSY